MLSVLAELVGIVALFLVQTEIQTDFILELPFLGRALAAGVPFLIWKSPFFRLLSENSFLDFFFPGSFPLDLCLLLFPEMAVPETTAPEMGAPF